MANTFDLRKLLSGDINRLRYIKRFGTAFVLHPESVAEHSYYVSLYALFIATWVREQQDKEVDFEELLTRCLVHDLEETRTGDFPRPFKYRYKALRTAIEQCAKAEFKAVVSDILPVEQDTENLVSCWEYSKDETTEGRIVAFADFLSVLSHLWQEIQNSNQSMADHYKTVRDYVESFNEDDYDFIRPLVVEASDLTDQLFKTYTNRRIV